MQIGKDSSLSLNELKGALLFNENNAEFRIRDFYVNLDDATKVMVALREYDEEGDLMDGSCGVYLADIKNWSIQLQRGFSDD
tara:strand:- start:70 stop:315 length:246 start_codon:yes stop_codon:yes gene_type:complete